MSLLVLAGFCLLATATLLGLESPLSCFPLRRRTRRLERLRHSLEVHRDGAIVVIAAIVGLWLLGDGLSAIVSSF